PTCCRPKNPKCFPNQTLYSRAPSPENPSRLNLRRASATLTEPPAMAPCDHRAAAMKHRLRENKERTMKSEEIKKMTDSALTELIQALEQGKSECLQNYLSTMARFHRYSWGNVLLISMQKPQATRVAGYQTWLKMNRHVRKGERGIVIIAPMVVRKKET